VDGLERDLKGRAAVLRLDMLSGVGRDAASQFGVKAVPTTLVFDGYGQVVLRQVGSVDAGAIRAQVADLTTAR
jgi:thioredoxin-like negative regulator of GroEL